MWHNRVDLVFQLLSPRVQDPLTAATPPPDSAQPTRLPGFAAKIDNFKEIKPRGGKIMFTHYYTLWHSAQSRHSNLVNKWLAFSRHSESDKQRAKDRFEKNRIVAAVSPGC